MNFQTVFTILNARLANFRLWAVRLNPRKHLISIFLGYSRAEYHLGKQLGWIRPNSRALGVVNNSPLILVPPRSRLCQEVSFHLSLLVIPQVVDLRK